MARTTGPLTLKARHRSRPSWRAALGLPAGAIGFGLTAAMITLALLAPLLAPADPFALSAAPLRPPSMTNLMGTDALGRDVLSGILFGARTSLLVASAVTALAFACAAAVGMTAGYRGGLVDDVLMRLTELFQVLPRFFLVIITIALFGPGVDRMVLILGLTSWPVLARVLRGEVLAMRDLDFLVAARATGGSALRILSREILPNVLPSALVLLALLFGQILLIEASLGFLGLGDPNALSWGLLAGQAQGFLRVAWWLALFPGLAIALTVLGVNLLADACGSILLGDPNPSPLEPLGANMKFHRSILTLSLLAVGSTALPAQGPMRAAPSGRATTEVALTFVDSAVRAAAQPSKIRIDYGQPHLRGRKLLTDSLVPYDKAWRTGANGATMLTTDVDVIIGGASVPKGTYVLQTMPSRTGWKLLIQKDMGQSPMAAAMIYDPANDVARVELRQATLAAPLESLTIWLIPSTQPGPPRGELRLAWGTIALATDWSVK